MKIYTRKGDLGETGLVGGPRVGKDMARIEVCGTLDELTAILGVSRSEPLPEGIDRLLGRLQNELFDLGAELATPNPTAHKTQILEKDRITAMEAEIDQYSADLPPLKQFILPGGTPAAAQIHLGRTVCRRAERRLVTLIRQAEEEIRLVLLAYLNRLGDLLFVLARAVNARAGVEDIPWQSGSDRGQ